MLPVVDVSHARVGHIVRVEAPWDSLGGDRHPAAACLGAGGLVGSAVPLVDVVNTAVIPLTSQAASQTQLNILQLQDSKMGELRSPVHLMVYI